MPKLTKPQFNRAYGIDNVLKNERRHLNLVNKNNAYWALSLYLASIDTQDLLRLYEGMANLVESINKAEENKDGQTNTG